MTLVRLAFKIFLTPLYCLSRALALLVYLPSDHMRKTTPVLPHAKHITVHVHDCTHMHTCIVSILIKESLSVCHANKLTLFSAECFPLPASLHRTTASLPYLFNVHCTFGCYALEAQVRRYAANLASTTRERSSGQRRTGQP